jgi:hypothetical protein
VLHQHDARCGRHTAVLANGETDSPDERAWTPGKGRSLCGSLGAPVLAAKAGLSTVPHMHSRGSLMKKMRRLLPILAAAALVAAFAAPVSAGTAVKASVIYSSLLGNPLPGNSPSVGFEADSISEFGNAVTFAGTNRTLTSVIVTMSSWGCTTGGAGAGGNCVTTPGATFSEPITFNIYNPSTDGGLTPGTLITTLTQTFNIPYRPSASPKCTDGRWWDTSSKLCFNGLADNITFNFSGVSLPDSVVYGIAYNTTDYGNPPIGPDTSCPSGGCGYDSLNVALSSNVTAGSNTAPGTTWMNSLYGGYYCDLGAAGVGVFRLDSPGNACWTNFPAVQFKASK